MSTPAENTDIMVAIAILGTKLDNLETTVKELKSAPPVVVQPAPAAGGLPLSGGIAGLVAAAWTLYLQATGKG